MYTLQLQLQTNYVTLRDISIYINLHMGVQCVPWRRLELNGRSSSYSSPPVRSDSFFCCFFFVVRLLLLEPYDCTLCQREDITSWPHISLRTLIITYFSVTTCIFFWYIYIDSGTLSLSCYVHVYKLTAKLYRIKYYTRIKVLNKYYKGENNFSFLKIPHSGIILIRFTRPNRVYHAANPKRIMFQTISTA